MKDNNHPNDMSYKCGKNVYIKIFILLFIFVCLFYVYNRLIN